MSDLFDAILADDSTVLVARPTRDVVFTFSNSGRGGKRNWFAMTGSQISSCLEDLLSAGSDLPAVYHEKTWRGIFAELLTDDVARTMGAVQTLPLFEILAKIIHYTNADTPRRVRTINLDPAALRRAMAVLETLAPPDRAG